MDPLVAAPVLKCNTTKYHNMQRLDIRCTKLSDELNRVDACSGTLGVTSNKNKHHHTLDQNIWGTKVGFRHSPLPPQNYLSDLAEFKVQGCEHHAWARPYCLPKMHSIQQIKVHTFSDI